MQEILSKKDIGNRIKALRISSGCSQAFIANVLNLSRSNYSQIELGNQYPTFNTLHELARYYSKTYEWLLHGDAEGESDEGPRKIDVIIQDMEAAFKNFSTSLKQLEHEMNLIKFKKAKVTKDLI